MVLEQENPDGDIDIPYFRNTDDDKDDEYRPSSHEREVPRTVHEIFQPQRRFFEQVFRIFCSSCQPRNVASHITSSAPSTMQDTRYRYIHSESLSSIHSGQSASSASSSASSSNRTSTSSGRTRRAPRRSSRGTRQGRINKRHLKSNIGLDYR